MSLPKSILIVDDDVVLRNAISDLLLDQEYMVYVSGDGVEALDLIKEHNPDLVVMDVTLPGKDGLDLLREMRQNNWSNPVILLSGKKIGMVDAVLGLELGADDYLRKPMENRELLARIRAHLRRSEVVKRDTVQHNISFGDLEVDLDKRIVLLRGEEVRLTQTEFELLRCLVQKPGQVVSRIDLLKDVWKYDKGNIATRTVDAHIYRLRRKLDDVTDEKPLILSVPGVGYRTNTDIDAEDEVEED